MVEDTVFSDKYKCIYLCGAMEFTDDGETWRAEVADLVAPYGYTVWNPYDYESRVEVPKGLNMGSLDKQRDFDLLRSYMKELIMLDLGALANTCGLVFARVDSGLLRGAGSISEMSFATYLGKSVHVWMDGLTMNDLPAWLCGTIDTFADSLVGAVDEMLSFYGHRKEVK